jgi:creatinine amidohydrolase
VPLEYARISARDLENVALKGDVIAVIPLGSVEQHCEGPLGLDSMVAERLAYEACRRLEEEGRATCLILPTIHYGYSPEWSRVRGTISLPLHVYAKLLEEVIEGVVRGGVKRVVLLNAHGGNAGVAEAILRGLASKHEGLVLALVNYWELLNVRLDHGGPVEEAVARALGLEVDFGNCVDVGYESRPRVILGSPREPSRVVLEGTVPPLGPEALIGALAEALRKIASESPLKHSI